jgi:hypothetical protein
MANTYELSGLYKQAFGDYVRLSANELKSDNVTSLEPPEIDNLSQDVLNNTFNAVASALGVTIFMPVKIGNLWLPNEPLVSVAFSKKIVQTDLSGNDGTVKELMGVGDWEISIRGIATNDRLEAYPSAKVKEISDICKAGRSLDAISPLFQYVGITRIAIRRLNFQAIEGMQNAQPFEIQALSDNQSDMYKQLNNQDASL